MKKWFDFSHLRGDLLGGITAGVVALPLALAFGVSSGLGPSAGLYGAIFVSFFASLFGGTATQISGPTAPMTAVSMVVIAGIVSSSDGNIDKALPIILGVFLIAGLLQIGFGLLKIGKYIKYMPYPVVSGFMTAIGVIILITQILPFLGYYPTEDAKYVSEFNTSAKEVILDKILIDESSDGLVLEDFKTTIDKAQKVTSDQVLEESKNLAAKNASGVIGSLRVFPRAIQQIDWLELILALVTIFIIYGFKRITTKIPSTLVALLVVSGGAVLLGLDYRPIQTIPSGLPVPNLSIFSEFSFASLSPYFFSALTLALLGVIDTLLTSIVADNMTKTRHESNTELVGQGIGNSVAAIFGGIPGAGATIRTVVNINAGGVTRISGMVAGILLLIILLALGPIASQIPAAVLAGILITVGIGVMDYKGLKAVPLMPRPEVMIMIVVLILSSVWNLVYAVGIGLVISSLIFMKKMGDLTNDNSSVLKLNDESFSAEVKLNDAIKNQISVQKINGPLFFGFTNEFQDLAQKVPKDSKYVVLDFINVGYIDQSGLFKLEDVVNDFIKDGKEVFLINTQAESLSLLEKINLVPNLIQKKNVFDSMKSLLESLK